MTETSRFWNSTTVGDATVAPYDAPTEFAQVLRSISGGGGVATNLGGIFENELNELAVTGAVTPVSVASGRALADGNWYESDGAVTVAIATPAASTRIDRIVLRKDWTAQTVRITRIAGTEGAGAPALVQTPGTTWDTPLAQVSVTTGGAITVTDERVFIGRIILSHQHTSALDGGAGIQKGFVLRKAAAETVNNSSVLQDDADFLFAIAANEIWAVDMHIFITSGGATADAKVTWVLPAGASMLLLALGIVDTNNTSHGEGTTPGTAVVVPLAFAGVSTIQLHIYALLVNGATPGTAQFQWAQNVATVEDLSFAINSYLVANKLA